MFMLMFDETMIRLVDELTLIKIHLTRFPVSQILSNNISWIQSKLIVYDYFLFRNFLYVTDVAEAFISILHKGSAGQSFVYQSHTQIHSINNSELFSEWNEIGCHEFPDILFIRIY